MSPEQFRKARQELGLTLHDFGLMLGYEDSPHLRGQIHKMETGDKPVRPAQARLTEAYLAGYQPEDWLGSKDSWPKQVSVEQELSADDGRKIKETEIRSRIAKLREALMGEDDLGAIVRAHIMIESELQDFICRELAQPEFIKFRDFDYDKKVQLAMSLGLIGEFAEPLKFLGKLRNSFAHKPDFQMGKQEANNFFKALGPLATEGTRDAYASTLAKVGTNLPKEFRQLPPKDQIVLYSISLFALLGVAAYKDDEIRQETAAVS